ncbi:glycoside hydrolase family 15 protein [Leptolyngbya sp. FACHB-711]|uniref:glycoside hydrolase family 15 protein n=1 Tax=Leptolyngbya sp. FACHB-711 TaxID=2692813 RepID=UPI0016864765|nr:glycoside hydrolase family 15 protein [Leptolyngbya sp. FACHB-711]MBD2027925.1 glycoside hydrolase family 15 protein [Leptolyngbya sp. FACHB-711]
MAAHLTTSAHLTDDLALQSRLDAYYQEICAVILDRQHPVTGLLPASTAITAHGNYTDAWVRDNVYSILAVWGLGLAYRKVNDDRGRAYELEYSVVKLMRGLLFAMMRQAHKVEKFKVSQGLLDALHAKYDTQTADVVVGDDGWGHLQLDATSLYLLMLAQMTVSGLQIVFTIDEVNFIQNLVYYIGRTYRTPDYGIWERGNKMNHGKPELNASSIGMAKAALEAINGLDLFGVRGSQASVIHVLPDEIARARITLDSLLPRESASKEVDGALLSVIGFPAFAIEDRTLVDRTRDNVISKLQGNYGCKRFLRDGHQTVIEDVTRLHYEPKELKQFEHIECEWPLFFTYLLLDALFRDDREQAERYDQKLQPLLIEQNGFKLLPELYFVLADKIEAERSTPHSQTRLPNENVPLVWAQSLYLLGQMIREGLLAIGDIDPLGRHRQSGKRQKPLVQIALLTEDEMLQAELATYGIATQTPAQVAPIQVRRAEELSRVYSQIGRNDKLKLTGRPVRRLRSMTTSRIFKVRGETIVFLPAFLDPQQFYLTLDYHFLVAQIKGELAYIQRHWRQLGRPTMTLLLTHAMFQTEAEQGSPDGVAESSPLLKLLRELQEGSCNGVPVKLGDLKQMMLTAGIERVDFLHDFEFAEASVQNAAPAEYYLTFYPDRNAPLSNTQEFLLAYETNIPRLLDLLQQSVNLYEQIDLLENLSNLCDLTFDTGLGGSGQPVTIAMLLDEVYSKASQIQLWAVIRRVAGLLHKVDVSLSDAVTDILVRGKQISVGKAYTEASLITSPLPATDIMDKIQHFCSSDVRERPLTQEILIYLSVLIKTDPQLFKGLLTLRVSYLILLITTELAREQQITQDEAYERLMRLSPFEIKLRLMQVLAGYNTLNQSLFQQESLHVRQTQEIEWVISAEANVEAPAQSIDWWKQRQRDGALNRVPTGFYPSVWQVMRHCKGVVIGDKLDRRNRLDSEVLLAEMTPGEKNFALRVEHLLNNIQASEYRQVNIEALMELAAIADRNPDLQIEEYIVLDVLIGHAVRLAWLDHHPDAADTYDQQKGVAWRSFYETSPYVCAKYIAKALRFLTELGQAPMPRAPISA